MRRRSRLRRPAVLLLAALPLLAGGAPASAEFTDHSYLLDLSAGSAQSARVRSAGRGGYALSGGQRLSLHDWYSPDMPELTLRMMTEVSDGFGITWGMSTGERGAKYRIAPALHLGFVMQTEIIPNGRLSLSGSTLLGGNLTEAPCRADYGEFGEMPVNCRLAAGLLPPEETLGYLLDLDGWRTGWLALQFEYSF